MIDGNEELDEVAQYFYVHVHVHMYAQHMTSKCTFCIIHTCTYMYVQQYATDVPRGFSYYVHCETTTNIHCGKWHTHFRLATYTSVRSNYRIIYHHNFFHVGIKNQCQQIVYVNHSDTLKEQE